MTITIPTTAMPHDEVAAMNRSPAMIRVAPSVAGLEGGRASSGIEDAAAEARAHRRLGQPTGRRPVSAVPVSVRSTTGRL
jgi:hypothetical protein